MYACASKSHKQKRAFIEIVPMGILSLSRNIINSLRSDSARFVLSKLLKINQLMKNIEHYFSVWQREFSKFTKIDFFFKHTLYH